MMAIRSRNGSFVGAKGAAGTWQKILSWIPPHDIYVEPFAGTAAVCRHKRPAARSILIDCDPGALDRIGDGGRRPGVETIVGDGVEWLRRWRIPATLAVLIYCDPPYVRSTRADPERDYYGREWSDADHEHFLDVVVEAAGGVDDSRSADVLISGYWSELYARRLAGWATDHFRVVTRGGRRAEEWLWANYPRPRRLHDYRFIGRGFADRWRIHKRQRSWCRMLERMPELERRAMLAALAAKFDSELMEVLNGR